MADTSRYTIYMIHAGADIYIGMTGDYKGRMSEHKYAVNGGNSRTGVHAYIRSSGGWSAFQKTRLRVWTTTKPEALLAEAQIISALQPNLNSIAGITEPGQPVEGFTELGLHTRTPEEMLEYKREYNRRWRAANRVKYDNSLAKWRQEHPNYMRRRREYEAEGRRLRRIGGF